MSSSSKKAARKSGSSAATAGRSKAAAKAATKKTATKPAKSTRSAAARSRSAEATKTGVSASAAAATASARTTTSARTTAKSPGKADAARKSDISKSAAASATAAAPAKSAARASAKAASRVRTAVGKSPAGKSAAGKSPANKSAAGKAAAAGKPAIDKGALGKEPSVAATPRAKSAASAKSPATAKSPVKAATPTGSAPAKTASKANAVKKSAAPETAARGVEATKVAAAATKSLNPVAIEENANQLKTKTEVKANSAGDATIAPPPSSRIVAAPRAADAVAPAARRPAPAASTPAGVASSPARAVVASVSKTPSASEALQVTKKTSEKTVGAASADAAPKPAPVATTTTAETKPLAAKPALPVKPKMASPKHGFKQNEFIVYPAHGVGQITGVEIQEVAGFSLELFVVSFIKDKMILKVPTSKVTSVGMRKLAEAEVVDKALSTLSGRARIKRTMWSRRAQEYEAKINSGDLVTIAEVVRDLYRSDTQPEQSYSERQLYEAALDRMAREIAAVRKLIDSEALKLIESFLLKGPRRGQKTDAELAEDGDDTDVEDKAA